MVKRKRRKPSEVIARFKDKHAFLSNFFPCEIKYHDEVFPTVENAFQALKTSSKRARKPFQTCSPSQAKHLGQKVELIDDWESSKISIMHILLIWKFSREPFNRLLLSTGEKKLVEGNTWHDNFWGRCFCRGCRDRAAIAGYAPDNILGKLLMDVRKNIVAVASIKESVSGAYIGRGSIYGNPYIIGTDGAREDVIRKYHKYFHIRIKHDQRFREFIEDLRGRFIICHCFPLACHGDIIARYLHTTYFNNVRSKYNVQVI